MNPTQEKPKLRARFTNAQGERTDLLSDGTKRNVPNTAIKTPKIETPTISADTMAAPVPDIKLTTPAPNTEMAALGGMVESQVDDFNKNLQAQQAAAETGKTTTLDKYIKALQGQQGIDALTLKAEEETGVQPLEQELLDINNQIRQESLGLRRAKERILAEGGQSKAQAQAAINNLERDSFAKQADLSIIQLAKQGAYDSAKAIADRKANALFKQEENTIAALKFDYEENRDLFNKSEQRAFDSLLADRTNKLAEDKAKQQQISDFALTALQSGATVAEAQSILGAKSLDEAIKIGGNYLRPKPANVAAKIPELKNFGTADNPNWREYNFETGQWEEVKGIVDTSTGSPLKTVKDAEIIDLNNTQIATNSMTGIIDEMINGIKENGTKVFWGSEAGKRGANKTNLLLAMKNLEKTGALDAGTINVLSDTIPDNEFFATEARQIAALENLKKTVTGKTNEFIKSYIGTTAEIDPRTARIYSQYKPTLQPEDSLELDTIFGTSSQSTVQFDPANYFNK